MALAVAAAIAMDRTPVVRRAVEPILVTSQTIPIVALAPLFLLWFGFGLVPKVLVVVLVTFFPIVVALLDGFGAMSPEATDLMRSYGATAGQDVPLLRWPSALPNAVHRAADLRGLRGDRGGVRRVRRRARGARDLDAALANAFRTDLVFAAIVVTSALSLVLYWAGGRAAAGRRSRGRPACGTSEP